jgi:hypothetical protein
MRSIVIAVPTDKRREYLAYSIRKKFAEITEKTSSVTCIQTRLDLIQISNEGKLVIEYRIVIVPITAGIERLHGLNPDVIDIRQMLTRLDEIKKELMFLASNPYQRHKEPIILADWNLNDEATSG